MSTRLFIDNDVNSESTSLPLQVSPSAYPSLYTMLLLQQSQTPHSPAPNNQWIHYAILDYPIILRLPPSTAQALHILAAHHAKALR